MLADEHALVLSNRRYMRRLRTFVHQALSDGPIRYYYGPLDPRKYPVSC
jgi:hypothetical protein